MQDMGSRQGFWSLLTRDEQRALLAVGRDKKYPPGAALCLQGDPATHEFVLLNGWVKILSVTDDGHESVLALLGDGDVVGETAGEIAGHRNATIQAISAVHALIVSYDRFSSFLDTHPGADQVYRRMMTQRWSETGTMLRRRAFTSGAQRLAEILIDLAGRHGGGTGGVVELALPLSQEELASLTGASRATVTRALSSWRKRGLIRTGQRRITITNLQALRQIAGPPSAGQPVIQHRRGRLPALARHTPDVITQVASSPYKGLHAFEQADYDLFFGREAMVRELVRAVNTQALVPVVGASGVGKSSVVHAGLLPRLGEQGPGWGLVTVRPRPTLLAALASGLARLSGSRVPVPIADVEGWKKRLLQGGLAGAAELALLAERVRSWLAIGIEPNAIGIAARSASLVREAREALAADGVKTVSLGGRRNTEDVRAGTMHAMKGLEFQAVAVIGVEQGLVPEPAAVTAQSEDPLAHAQDLQRERCILFVACTRARDYLYVSGTGSPSMFLPNRETAPARPGCDSVSPDAKEEPAKEGPALPRKVSTTELLGLREKAWEPRLRGASLVAEADLRSAHTNQVAAALGRLYPTLRDPRTEGESFLLRWPACLAAAMAGVAATEYHGGTYWPEWWEIAGFQGTSQDQQIWGRAFNRAVDRLGMATFPELPLHFVGPILMHAGIPTYCLSDYFRLLLSRRRLDPGLDAESFLAWATAPGRKLRLADLDMPARRFLTDGGDYAFDVVDRCLDLLDRLTDPDPDLDGVRLPARIVEAARHEAAAQGLDKPSTRRNEIPARKSAPRPRIGLDPYGMGVQVILPAVGEAPDGVATWRVTADGDPVTVRSRAQWVGSAEAAPQTTHPLARPVRTVQVSLVGWDHVSELDVVHPSDPILFFSEDGRRLPPQLPLPPDHLWILRPADRELTTLGELHPITESPAPFGWEGWHLQLASLEKASSLSLQGCPAHVVQGYARPRLLLGEPLPGVTTPYGSPVYPEPPQLWLPDTPASAVSWHVDIRPPAGGLSLFSGEMREAGTVDIWNGVPRPVLGAFDITVRGPLGRGMRRTIFVAEGVSVSYLPSLRALRMSGLEPGTARLQAPIGGAANPARVSFDTSDRARVVELRTRDETEPVVVTPPHIALLCEGAGVTTWTAAPIHAATEAMADLGRLLIRAPGAIVKTDLEVWAGPSRIQTIPATGGQAPGLAGYDLPRASETVAHSGRAELLLPWGQGAMPVGVIRPRRLGTGAEVGSGQLRIRDCAPVEGLTGGLYLARAPWRAPVILRVPRDGIVQLPPGAREAGPLRVLLRVEDPWTVTDWPTWPTHGSYACDAPGIPASADPEEDALSRFLAGEGDLPAAPRRVERLWRLIHLADDLVAAGAPANLRERCSAAIRDQAGLALTRLLDTGLDSSACVAGLISTGLAAARPMIRDDPRAVEQLWNTVPAAAAVLSSRLFARPAGSGQDRSAALLDAALAQCGPNLEAMLDGDRDPSAQVGQFGPDAERMAHFSAEQVEAVWQAAAVVPQTLLDADTRAVAARQMFDARRTPELARAARDANLIIRSAERLLGASPYRSALAQIAARRHPDGKGGWLALPAMSASLALVARVAARDNDACQSFERLWRDRWTDLARQAPDMTSIDLVLAEALIAGAERARLAGETA